MFEWIELLAFIVALILAILIFQIIGLVIMKLLDKTKIGQIIKEILEEE